MPGQRPESDCGRRYKGEERCAGRGAAGRSAPVLSRVGGLGRRVGGGARLRAWRRAARERGSVRGEEEGAGSGGGVAVTAAARARQTQGARTVFCVGAAPSSERPSALKVWFANDVSARVPTDKRLGFVLRTPHGSVASLDPVLGFFGRCPVGLIPTLELPRVRPSFSS